MPTRAMNIIGAKFVWVKMGRPWLPKEPIELGKTIPTNKQTIKDVQN